MIPSTGRRINPLAQRFVVETDIAARDRRLEERTGFRDAFDRFHQLRHDLGPLRIAEVQIVRRRDRHRTRGREVAAAFGDRQFRAFARIEIAVTPVAIERHRDRSAGLLHAHNSRVRARSHDRVGADRVVVLLPDPALGTDVGRGQKPQQIRIQILRGGDVIRRPHRRLAMRFHAMRTVILRRFIGQSRVRNLRHDFAMMPDAQVPIRSHHADGDRVESPLAEDVEDFVLHGHFPRRSACAPAIRKAAFRMRSCRIRAAERGPDRCRSPTPPRLPISHDDEVNPAAPMS